MHILNAKRLSAFSLALIMASFLLLSPLIDVYGEHDHSCSPNKCINCLTSGVLSYLRDYLFLALSIAVALTVAHISSFFRFLNNIVITFSPVLLKTKITS